MKHYKKGQTITIYRHIYMLDTNPDIDLCSKYCDARGSLCSKGCTYCNNSKLVLKLIKQQYVQVIKTNVKL